MTKQTICEERLAAATERAAPPEYPTRQFLDLSTGAISSSTRAWLDVAALHMNGAITAHGWFVHVGDSDADYPDDFQACLRAARARGCDYILFDADAATDYEALGLVEHDD